MKINDTEIKIIQADLVGIRTDAFVNPADGKLVMARDWPAVGEREKKLCAADEGQVRSNCRRVLEEAKEKGVIRAHGCSCHSIEALRAAAKSSWVEVDSVRINPIGSHMDDSPETVLSVLRQMRAAGKGIVGMKILGQGDLRERQDEALKYALSLGLLDAFTIGAESKAQQEDLIRRIGAIAA